jgi:hypothetical protein
MKNIGKFLFTLIIFPCMLFPMDKIVFNSGFVCDSTIQVVHERSIVLENKQIVGLNIIDTIMTDNAKIMEQIRHYYPNVPIQKGEKYRYLINIKDLHIVILPKETNFWGKYTFLISHPIHSYQNVELCNIVAPSVWPTLIIRLGFSGGNKYSNNCFNMGVGLTFQFLKQDVNLSLNHQFHSGVLFQGYPKRGYTTNNFSMDYHVNPFSRKYFIQVGYRYYLDKIHYYSQNNKNVFSIGVGLNFYH